MHDLEKTAREHDQGGSSEDREAQNDTRLETGLSRPSNLPSAPPPCFALARFAGQVRIARSRMPFEALAKKGCLRPHRKARKNRTGTQRCATSNCLRASDLLPGNWITGRWRFLLRFPWLGRSGRP